MSALKQDLEAMTPEEYYKLKASGFDTEPETIEVDEDVEELDFTRRRIQKIEGFEFLKKIKLLCLRWNLILKIENVSMLTTLTELDLYDNQITVIENLDGLVNLETLDLSFNRITKLQNLGKLSKLKTAYFVHNKIEKIEGLEALENLEYLEIGDNRIRIIENLEKNGKLERLFLGANQIKKIHGVGHLQKLQVLSLPANAIEDMEGLENLTALRELYLSQNGIPAIGQLKNEKLEILDINHNRVRKIANVRHLKNLTDFWAKHNKIVDWSDLDELAALPKLSLVYLDFNPLSSDSNYRSKAIRALPQVKRIDAEVCRL
ncbi:hypothetical protein L596_010990 [Steinernema carpocapsae]|uniref:Protein phosphatase 1 regulatory subunit 7 n=1 Tax=Steinernema carpocapsae TaxID=34508 RepID=A0A4U5NRF6_STECR|nr:hypothetical protein L596_010990 [Steinernema carpocapsae]